ncbi:alpha/beta fold hydrolase [Leptolyngbya sp. FACHB-261]|uniref:alpha/beta fold hydrolase n=1 Tax=Leptolyngbya sp. FACHB-261 TaxID=2692806 RepID=UPI0037BE3328
MPTLILQGEADRILPYHSTGARLPKLIKDSHFVVISGGPHAVIWTSAEQVNPAWLNFLKQGN